MTRFGNCVVLLLGVWALGLVTACQSDPGPAPAGSAAVTGRTSAAAAPAAKLGGSMILATTTSTRDSGLLDELAPRFEAQTGVQVKVIAVGTGAALRMAGQGNADAVLVHAPAAEQKYVESGDLTAGKLVMHNDFVYLGPPDDPAGAKQHKKLEAALAAIAAKGRFISRGDDSGTHKKELELWRAAGVDVATLQREESGQGMGATLAIADQRGGYTLTDRGTYLALKQRLKLTVVLEGDERLLNPYRIYVVSPRKHPKVKLPQAQALGEFLVSPEAQRIIAVFGQAKLGQPLFVPDALSDSRAD